MQKNDNMDLTHSNTADSLAGEYIPNSKSTDLAIKPSASNLDNQPTTGNVHDSSLSIMFLDKTQFYPNHFLKQINSLIYFSIF